MKKIVNLLLVLTLALTLLAVPALADEVTEGETTTAVESVTVAESAAAGAVMLSVSADKTNVQPGDKITFTISVGNAENSGIAGLDFNVIIPDGLEYDSHVVNCAGTKFAMANYNTSEALFQGTGTATMDGINDASWTVMTLTCKVKADAATGKDYTLSLKVNDLYNSALADIASTAGSASVNIPCAHAETELKNATAATCTSAGYTGDTVCKNCGATVTSGSVIAKSDHNWNAGTITTEATCTTVGEKTVTCTVCGETKTEKIPAGHKWDEGEVTTEATCTTDGEILYTCTVCSETKTEKISAGHTWDEGKVTKEATTTEKGEKLYTCTVCGETKVEEISALGSSTSTTAQKTSPKTGDEANIALWLVLAAICAAGLCAVPVLKKRSHH